MNHDSRVVFAIALVTCLASCLGCGKSARRNSGPSTSSQEREDPFPAIAETINTLDAHDANQIVPQLRDRLNQWVQQESPTVKWQPDTLLNGMSDELRALPVVKGLGNSQYAATDVMLLQEVVWLRDIAQRGRSGDDLAVANRLFDWTVRNIQLEPDAKDGAIPRLVSETLLIGRGTAIERSWLFILLCRQQKLDAVMLAIAGDDDTASRPWCAAVLSGGELYLFDERLGLPIAGPAGEGVASLSQVAADESLLRKLDQDAEHLYPVSADDLKHVVALIEGSPAYLSKRMKLIDSRLTGKQKLVLSASPETIAKRLADVPHVTAVKLWDMPYQVWSKKTHMDKAQSQAAMKDLLTLQPNMPLGQGRVRHFKGDFDSDDGAKKHYMDARPSGAWIYQVKENPEKMLTPEMKSRGIDRAQLERVVGQQIGLVEAAKQSASLWLGLIAFEEQDYPVAIDYFAERTLAAFPKGIMTAAARYNLARAYEASGDSERAIALYEADTSPQSHGNKLRARKLKSRITPVADTPGSPE